MILRQISAGAASCPDAGLAFRPHLHGLGSVHHAGVPQEEIWRTANKGLPLCRLAPSLHILQNCRMSRYCSTKARYLHEFCPMRCGAVDVTPFPRKSL